MSHIKSQITLCQGYKLSLNPAYVNVSIRTDSSVLDDVIIQSKETWTLFVFKCGAVMYTNNKK